MLLQSLSGNLIIDLHANCVVLQSIETDGYFLLLSSKAHKLEPPVSQVAADSTMKGETDGELQDFRN